MDKHGIAANSDPYQRIISYRSKQKSLSEEAREEIDKRIAAYSNSLVKL
jgi:hypothetical protein